MPQKINIIGKSNGAGLSRDLVLLAGALRGAGHEVSILEIDDIQARRRRSLLCQWAARAGLWRQRSAAGLADADVNLMLEHVWPQYLGTARTNIGVPNPEWFDRHDRSFLSSIDGIWAKTCHTQELFSALGCNTTLVGFDGTDRNQPAITRERTFFHLAGKSQMKGTEQLLQVWARNPQWPPLIVIQHRREPDIRAHNIRRLVGYVDDATLVTLQNASMFHLCLSQAEGWGHYIVEAMSVGAVTITVDAPPMNELVSEERGLLVPCTVTGIQRLATLYEFDECGLEATIRQAIAMSSQDCRYLGTKARNWFLNNKQGFSRRLAVALEDVAGYLSAAS